MRYLHTRDPPIVHRDVTPNNILLSRHLNAKITDLDIAKVMQNTDTQSTITPGPGAADFMPHESQAKKPVYNTPLDVFSYGGVILYTAVQQWPSPDSWVRYDKNTGDKVYLSEVQRRQCCLDQMTGNITDLKPVVVSCLEDNPKTRPSMAEVSEKIKKLRTTSEQTRNDEISPNMWSTMMFDEQQQEPQHQQLVSDQ